MRSKQASPSENDLLWAVAWIDRLDAAAGKETWRGGKGEFPWCELPEQVMEFIFGCGTRNLMRHDYDPAILSKITAGCSALSGLDLTNTLKLLTAHIRADRFCEGHIAAALESGEIQAVLRHLGTLTSEAGTGPCPHH